MEFASKVDTWLAVILAVLIWVSLAGSNLLIRQRARPRILTFAQARSAVSTGSF